MATATATRSRNVRTAPKGGKPADTPPANGRINGNGHGTTGVTEALSPSETRHFTMLEKRIERGMSVFREVGEALMEIRDSRLYRQTHPNFDAYCRERWQFERGRANQLIGAAEVARALPSDTPAIMNEAQARELVPLVHENPKLVEEVWRQVTASDEPLSAPRIRQVVRQTMKTPEPVAVSSTVRLIDGLRKVGALFQTWKSEKHGKREQSQVEDAVNDLLKVLNA